MGFDLKFNYLFEEIAKWITAPKDAPIIQA
jgi:hypothetical protein